MNLSNLPPESNATAQLMVIQRLAHHEDRLLHSKPAIDNKLRDFSHLFNPSIPSKKKYLTKKRTKEIYDGNLSLLSRIYSITFDKNAEGSKYPGVPRKTKREDGANIILHPFSADHRSRSMNTQTRKRELDKINKDNSQLLEKLRTMKSTIPSAQEIKKRDRNLNYFKNMLTKKQENQQVRVLKTFVNQKANGDSILYKYMRRHDLLNSKPLHTHTNSTSFFKDTSHNLDFGAKLHARPSHEEKENNPEEHKDKNYALNSSATISDRNFHHNGQSGRNGRKLKPLGSGKIKKKLDQQHLEAEYKYFKEVFQKELDGMEKLDENGLEKGRESSPEKSFSTEIQNIEKNYSSQK